VITELLLKLDLLMSQEDTMYITVTSLFPKSESNQMDIVTNDEVQPIYQVSCIIKVRDQSCS